MQNVKCRVQNAKCGTGRRFAFFNLQFTFCILHFAFYILHFVLAFQPPLPPDAATVSRARSFPRSGPRLRQAGFSRPG